MRADIETSRPWSATRPHLAGEWITATGDWVNDRTHGRQFKARVLRASTPSFPEAQERYFASCIGEPYRDGRRNRRQRAVAQMAELLREAGADCIVDVRSIPRSRTNPQFNADVFPASLAAEGLDYYRIAELGGLRKRPKSGEPSPNACWENLSFRNYADLCRH